MAYTEQSKTCILKGPNRGGKGLGYLDLQLPRHCGQNLLCQSPWTLRKKKSKEFSLVEDWNKIWVLWNIVLSGNERTDREASCPETTIHCLIGRTKLGQAQKMVSALVLVIMSCRLFLQLCVKAVLVDFKLFIWGHQALRLCWERKLGSVCPLIGNGRWVGLYRVRVGGDLWAHWPWLHTFQRRIVSLPGYILLGSCHQPCYYQNVLVWLGFVIWLWGGLSAGTVPLKMVIVGKARSFGLKRNAKSLSGDNVLILPRWI